MQQRFEKSGLVRLARRGNVTGDTICRRGKHVRVQPWIAHPATDLDQLTHRFAKPLVLRKHPVKAAG